MHNNTEERGSQREGFEVINFKGTLCFEEGLIRVVEILTAPDASLNFNGCYVATV
jgi:hypothetical protein